MRSAQVGSVVSPTTGKWWGVIAFVCAAIVLGFGLWGLANIEGGLAARVATRRALSLVFLLAAGFGSLGVWLWRRSEHEARRTPEGRAGLMKIKRGDDWFAETIDGRWLRWDSVASDWTPTSPPEGVGLTRSRPTPQEPAASEEVAKPLPAEAQLAMMAAEAESRRHQRKMRRTRFGARTGASFVMGGLLVLLVGGLLVLLIAGVLRFLSDLPF